MDDKMMKLLDLVFNDRVVWGRNGKSTKEYNDNHDLIKEAVNDGLVTFFPSNNPNACRKDYVLTHKGLTLYRNRNNHN